MRIAIVSPLFAPSIGGIETVAGLLAREWAKGGNQVVLITDTRQAEAVDVNLEFTVFRSKPADEIRTIVSKCDVVVMMCISLRYLGTIFSCGVPIVISHQTWYQGCSVREKVAAIIKRALTPFLLNIAPSKAVARHIWGRSFVVGNPFDEDIFFQEEGTTPNPYSIVCLARLVSDKGVDLAIEACAKLSREYPELSLTVIGDGPERKALDLLVAKLDMSSRVCFRGSLQGDVLRAELNRHAIMVVPSRWNEPYGVVALEGIACGLVVVGSLGGGLSEAIGECGVTFKNQDLNDFIDKIRLVFNDHNLREKYRAHKVQHLAQLTAPHVANQYMKIIQRYCGRR